MNDGERGWFLKPFRMERPAKVVTTTMEIGDPRVWGDILFRAKVTVEIDDLPPGVSIDGVRLDWTDRRKAVAPAP